MRHGTRASRAPRPSVTAGSIGRHAAADSRNSLWRASRRASGGAPRAARHLGRSVQQGLHPLPCRIARWRRPRNRLPRADHQRRPGTASRCCGRPAAPSQTPRARRPPPEPGVESLRPDPFAASLREVRRVRKQGFPVGAVDQSQTGRWITFTPAESGPDAPPWSNIPRTEVCSGLGPPERTRRGRRISALGRFPIATAARTRERAAINTNTAALRRPSPRADRTPGSGDSLRTAEDPVPDQRHPTHRHEHGLARGQTTRRLAGAQRLRDSTSAER